MFFFLFAPKKSGKRLDSLFNLCESTAFFFVFLGNANSHKYIFVFVCVSVRVCANVFVCVRVCMCVCLCVSCFEMCPGKIGLFWKRGLLE